MGAIDWSGDPTAIVLPDGSSTVNRGPCGTCGSRTRIVWDDDSRYHIQCGRCVKPPPNGVRCGTFDTETGIYEISITERVRQYRERLSQATEPGQHETRG